MNLKGGSKSEYDWDEYSSELEDDYEDDYEDGEEEETVVASAAVAATPVVAEVVNVKSDWSMGSDGYWWYHDKQTNEWWYKNAEGEIVKYS